jgi:hypothetical protein
MIDRETLQAELRRIGNDLSKIMVGSFSGFHHVTLTPSNTFNAVDLHVPELGFLHIVARDSFRKDLLDQLVAAFERLRNKRYKNNMLYVFIRHTNLMGSIA